MRRVIFLLLFSLITFGLVASQPVAEVEKETFLYGVTDGGDSLYLDRYNAPEMQQWSESGAKPCLIFMFGGGFSSGERDAEGYLPFFEEMARRGAVVVSIDYRLGFKDYEVGEGMSPHKFLADFFSTVSMAVQDLYGATNYICSNAKEWGVDAEKIIISGSSAGAIAVLEAEYEKCNATKVSQLLPEGFDYAGVIAFAGAILGDSELHFLENPCPIMMFHGNADSNVPYDRIAEMGLGFHGSASISRWLHKYDSPYWFWSVESAAHELAVEPMSENCDEIALFIKKFVLDGEQTKMRTEVTKIGAPTLPQKFTVLDYLMSNFKQ